MNAATNPSSVVPFCFNESLVRTATIDDNPWFVAKDVCDILNIENATNAIRNIPENHKGLYPIKTLGGVQHLNLIDESGLYRLVIRSAKPEAEPFIEWVTSEVLPTIRRTGSYTIDKDDKRIFINHRRTTASAGGLDIRYALDLTRFIQRPNKTSITMLERITGIHLSDIPLDGCFDKDNPVASFVSRVCRQADPTKNRARIKDIYRRFCAFFREEKKTLRGVPSMREVSVELQKNGYESRKAGGVSYIYGIQLTEEV